MAKYGLNPLFKGIKNIYIPDIHGEGEKFAQLLNSIKSIVNYQDYRFVFLGDIVGKTRDLAKVLDLILELKSKVEVVIIKGNWEQSIIPKMISSPKSDDIGFIPSLKFLEEFGSNLDEANKKWTEKNYYEIFNDMIDYFETENVIATHAPLDNNLIRVYLDDENPEGLLDELASLDLLTQHFVSSEEKIELIEKLCICGHQPAFAKNNRFDSKFVYRKVPTIIGNRIFLDCGGAGNKKEIPLFAYIEDIDLIVSSF